MELLVLHSLVVMYNPNKSISNNTIKIGGVAIIVLILLYGGFITQFIQSFQSLVGGTMQERRIDEVISLIETGETTGDMNSREGLYMISLNAFLSHPLSFEYNINHIGKHSYLIDHLTAMGLIAFIPFALLLYYRYKRPMKQMGNEKGYYVMAYSAFILLSILKNFFDVESAVFACPALLIYIRRHFLGMKHLKTR